MGTASKVVSVAFRIGELICACIVLGIISRFLYLLDLANAHVESKIIYAEVIAGISVAASIILLPPFLYSFWAFPFDCAIFICWMVAFGLLNNVSAPIHLLPINLSPPPPRPPPLFFDYHGHLKGMHHS
jgi:hypothetical protein